MKYIVYLTTNIKNNKIYVGVHETENPEIFDGYIGCGVNIHRPSTIMNTKTPFTYAVKKYGFDSFKRAIIKVFNTKIEALDLEAEIVNEDFIKRDDTYNVSLGGGLPPLLNKIIYQYSLEGEFIKEWNSIVEAAKFYNVSESSIGKAVTFKRTSANFLWSDCKLTNLNLEEYSVYSPKIPIYLYNSDGTLYKSLNSMSDCVKELKCSLSNVQRSIKIGILVKGYYISDKLYSLYKKPKQNRLTGLIHQYDLNGIYIKSYNSIKEAEKELSMKLSGINDGIKLYNSYYNGFLWSRGDNPIPMNPYKKSKCSARKIAQYTMDDKLVKTFNTLRECRKEFPNVSKVLNGSAKHCHNYKFKYVEES